MLAVDDPASTQSGFKRRGPGGNWSSGEAVVSRIAGAWHFKQGAAVLLKSCAPFRFPWPSGRGFFWNVGKAGERGWKKRTNCRARFGKRECWHADLQIGAHAVAIGVRGAQRRILQKTL